MLLELRVRNLAVIESVAVRFAPGLNVLSGETGAGKSILVDALQLLCGMRAQADAIRAHAELALIEGVFHVENGRVGEILQGAGLAADDGQVVVRRELTRSGRHRAFVNDSPVTVGLLERLGEHLVEVHGQHEHQRLLQPGPQLDLLDRFAGAEALGARVAELYAKHRAAREALDGSRATARERAQREDLLRFQVNELEAARLRPGEEEELKVERRRLQHVARILGGLDEAEAQLDDDGVGARARLVRAGRLLRDLARLDPASSSPAEAIESAIVLLDEAVRAIRHDRAAAAEDPGRLEVVEERLDALAHLKRKYGDTEQAMLSFHRAAAADLDGLSRHDEVLAEQERILAELQVELEVAAAELSARRLTAASRLQTLVEREVRVLGMGRGVFRVALEQTEPAGITARGRDRVEFRLSANQGEDPKALARAVSGGELSRVMLGVRAVLAEADEVPTVIFDEVDAGIGGTTAGVVGERLAAVATRRQVLCVTHLAQIAARADHHVRVTKGVTGGRARATVEPLEGDARMAEVARMLGGETKAALAHARELVLQARARRR